MERFIKGKKHKITMKKPTPDQLSLLGSLEHVRNPTQRYFAHLQNKLGVSDTPRATDGETPIVVYPESNTDFSSPRTSNEQPFLPLEIGGVSLEQAVERLLQNMDRSLIEAVNSTGNYNYSGTIPIRDSSSEIGSRLYFDNSRAADFRLGVKETLLSKGLVVVSSLSPLNKRAIINEIVQNSKKGYHTLFVLHGQNKDRLYRDQDGKTFVLDSAWPYFTLGFGKVAVYEPSGKGNLVSLDLSPQNSVQMNPFGKDIGISTISYWPQNPMFRDISTALGGGMYTNGKFTPLEEIMDGKPLLLAQFKTDN